MSDSLSEIVEIGARARYEQRRQKFNPILAQNHHTLLPPWDDIPSDTKSDWMDETRAEVAALTAAGFAILPREPTEEMIAAAPMNGLADVEGVYRAMVETFSPVKG